MGSRLMGTQVPRAQGEIQGAVWRPATSTKAGSRKGRGGASGQSHLAGATQLLGGALHPGWWSEGGGKKAQRCCQQERHPPTWSRPQVVIVRALSLSSPSWAREQLSSRPSLEPPVQKRRRETPNQSAWAPQPGSTGSGSPWQRAQLKQPHGTSWLVRGMDKVLMLLGLQCLEARHLPGLGAPPLPGCSPRDQSPGLMKLSRDPAPRWVLAWHMGSLQME